MSDIRRLLESLDKLTEQAASSNVVQLPLGAPKGVPAGTQAFGQMGQVLTKPKQDDVGTKPAAGPKAAAPVPGQKSLPGFGITHLEPETPAYTPKQPWLDPKGSKEPAYMRKAAGITAPEPLGVIGGTGPDAKFAKAPVAANEPSIPKQTPKLAYRAPRVKVGTGSEYSNVYSTPRGAEGKPTFADTQYAKDVATQLKKFPDDPNLRAEYDSLQQKGLTPTPTPNATPLTRAQLDAINYNDRAAAAQADPQALPATKPEDAVRNAYRQSGAPITIPTSTAEPAEPVVPPSPLTTAQKNVPGVTKEHSEFSNFLDTEFPIRSPRLKEQTKGPIKPGAVPLEFPPGGAISTPGPVPRIPPNVNVPSYQRAGQPAAIPQGVESPKGPKTNLTVVDPSKQVGSTDSAANAPIMAQPIRQNPERAQAQARRRDQELLQTKPGLNGKPITPPEEKKLIPTPLPGKPGSVNRQRRKLMPPVAAAGIPGGGGEEGSTVTTQPVELWRDVDIPKTIERPADIPVEPVTPPVPAASEPKPVVEPSTKPSVSVPVDTDTDKNKDKDKSKGSDGGSEGGIGIGQGTGIGSGTEPGGGGSSPLGHSQRSVPGVTRESLSTKFYNVFKNFMEMQDKPAGKKK